jgi:hypothetical protein
MNDEGARAIRAEAYVNFVGLGHSAFGTKRTFLIASAMSAFGGKADIAAKCLCAMKHGVSRANTRPVALVGNRNQAGG